MFLLQDLMDRAVERASQVTVGLVDLTVRTVCQESQETVARPVSQGDQAGTENPVSPAL